jgi:hypothetical protein
MTSVIFILIISKIVITTVNKSIVIVSSNNLALALNFIIKLQTLMSHHFAKQIALIILFN